MFIKFFRKSYLLQYLALFFISVILWLPGYVKPLIAQPDLDPFLNPGFSLILWLNQKSILAGFLFAFVLVFFSAIMLNRILETYDLIPKNNLIPALVYMVLMSHSTEQQSLNPILISGLCLLVVLYIMFSIYNENEAYSTIFNAGVLIAFSSFFYFPSFIFIFFVWLTFFVYRLYHWREWVIVLAGFITPWLFLLVYFFWSDRLELVYNALMVSITGFSTFELNFHLPVLSIITLGFIALLFLWSFLKLAGELQEKVISIRKKYWSAFWFLFLGTVTFIFSGSDAVFILSYLAVPVTMFMAYALTHQKKLLWIDIIFSLLIFIIVIKNLIPGGFNR
jgi:hypothetical protein